MKSAVRSEKSQFACLAMRLQYHNSRVWSRDILTKVKEGSNIRYIAIYLYISEWKGVNHMFKHNHIIFKIQDWDEAMSFGRGFGHGFGRGFGAQRFFERGDLKFVILHLIKEQPRHGYDIIQELEKKFHGAYNPSAGTVYPILQLFEDQGYVTIDNKDGKKVYSITDSGATYLDEHKEELERMESLGERFGDHFGGGIHELKGEVRDVMRLIFHNAARGALKDPEKVKQLKEAFEEFRKKVEAIFA